MLRELLARAISALIPRFYLDYIVRLEIYKAAVFISVLLFLLLGKYNIALYSALYIMHLASKFYSLLIAKRLIGVYRLLRGRLILGYIRLESLKELKRAYPDALIV